MNKKILIIIFSAILIIAICFAGYAFYKEKKTTEFLDGFVLSLNHLSQGDAYLTLSSQNYILGNEYVYSGSYYYEYAKDYYDEGKEDALKSEDYYEKAENKLIEIKDKNPSKFYLDEVENRIEQARYGINLSKIYYSLNDYSDKSTYEINYGSKTKSLEYTDKANTLINESNIYVEQLNKVYQKIDLAWEQDWYPSFEKSTA